MNIQSIMFFIGYLLASLFTGLVTVTVGGIIWLASCRLKDSAVYDIACDILDVSRESFTRFLNCIRPVLPDKLREYVAYEMELW